MKFELKMRKWIHINYGTISNFANELGTSNSNISRYLNGSRKPGYFFLKKIEKLGCDLNWLIGEVENKAEVNNKFINASTLPIFYSFVVDYNYLCEILNPNYFL